MTRFIDVPTMAKYFNEKGIANLIKQLIPYLEDDFKQWDSFDKIPRVATHSDIGVIELMPIANDELYGFKYVNGHPSNYQHNLSTVMAFGALSEVSTGYPLLLSELTLSTAIRTAATSVMAALYLAKKGSSSMALIGNGSQSEFQALGFIKVMGIKEIKLYDIDPLATQKFLNNMQDLAPQVNFIVCKSAKEACQDVDIITTVTADKKNATIITPDMLSPGVHINGVGGDCPGKTELDGAILDIANVFVEFEPQSRIEGEIQHAPDDYEVVEMHHVIKGELAGRTNDNEITVFDSVGFALEDYSMLRMLYNLAKEDNIGTFIELVPTMDDPKDLVGLTKGKSKKLKLVA